MLPQEGVCRVILELDPRLDDCSLRWLTTRNVNLWDGSKPLLFVRLHFMDQFSKLPLFISIIGMVHVAGSLVKLGLDRINLLHPNLRRH